MGKEKIPDWQHSPSTDIWIVLLTIARVAFILVIFLVLFLAIFLGYFTIPLIVIAAIALFYLIFDAILYFDHRWRRPDYSMREGYLKSSDKDEPKD